MTAAKERARGRATPPSAEEVEVMREELDNLPSASPKRKALERKLEALRPKLDDGGVVDPERVEIVITGKQEREIIAEAWTAEIERGPREGGLFLRSGQVVNLRRGETLGICRVGRDDLHAHLIDLVDWFRLAPRQSEADPLEATMDRKPARLPAVMLGPMLAAPPALPELEAVVGAPVFDAQGALVAEPGYHAGSRLWFDRSGLAVREVPARPTAREVEAARELLVGDLLVDFPFASVADRTHAAAMLILPFVRRLVGPTPLHLIEAAVPGTGKSLLAQLAAVVATGANAKMQTLGDSEDEIRKLISSILEDAAPVVVLDNLNSIGSPTLASVLTTERWSDRRLGSNAMIDVPNHATWIATANNPRITTENARRCIRIRLVANVERPEERTGFRHPQVVAWALERRSELVRAILVVVRAWIDKGMPLANKPKGSFDRWAAVMGGILETTGFKSFLDNEAELRDQADTEGSEWRAFTEAWWSKFGPVPVSAGQLVTTATGVLGFLDPTKPDVSRATKLGHALRRHRDRIFAGRKLVHGFDSHTKTNAYRLVEVG